MKLIAPDKSELMNVAAIERDGDDLVIKGRVFGSMPISARLTPEQARAGRKLLNLRLVLFILSMSFRGKSGSTSWTDILAPFRHANWAFWRKKWLGSARVREKMRAAVKKGHTPT
jgi:hypothetical protein